MKTREKILKIIRERQQITAGEIAEYLDISRQALYKHLPDLLLQGKIIKVGKPPKVFYALKRKEKDVIKYEIDSEIEKIINENYLIISPRGEKIEGFEGFIYWCEKQNLPVEKTAKEYIATLGKYSAFKKDDLIDGAKKMQGTFKDLYLDDVYYLDFYSIERFGKTKLGQMLLYAKQSQNKKLMKELIENIKPTVDRMIKKFKIDAVGYVPPTVKREVQFMNELRKKLNLKVKEITITKIKTEIIVPQKTLNKIYDRIENAKRTFVVEEKGKYNNILLIDDAVGSGATLNEVAKKIKEKGLAKNVIGLAITGSFKGFDVISEV
ncbi:HTH domain-containing protein [Candidatus Parcubacteria bacterium]|nr:HTH domain-containing protein [Candidatus Parcubacteria bacterium]